MSQETARSVTFGEVLGLPEFRALWLSQVQSKLGDQLARVALALLVYDTTASAGLTGLTYAMTLLPPLLTASFLTGLADRYPRRTVLVFTDLARAALVAVIAIPGLPLAAAISLLAVMVGLQPLFMAARNAMLPTMLPGDRYTVGLGVMGVTDTATQVIGFVGGGLVVASFGGAHVALALDAASFALSAVALRVLLSPHRPVLSAASASAPRPRGGGASLIWRNSVLRGLIGQIWLYGFFVAPEVLAAPYSQQLHAGPATVGLFMAADPVGATVGTLLLTRFVRPGTQTRLLAPLAVATGLPLVISAFIPGVGSAIFCWTLTGVLSSYLVVAQGLLTRATPDIQRARVFGMSSAGLQTTQGVCMLAAGFAAEFLAPSTVVGLSGALGCLCALLLGRATASSARPGSA
jgi:MFS family permease